MGRRLNQSMPTVINTELIPLDESFRIEGDGQLEQWYYENNAQYAPNRQIIPLTLTPVLSAHDRETNTAYTPTFNTVTWYVNEWDNATGDYVETVVSTIMERDTATGDYIENPTTGVAPYVVMGNELRVKRNVPYAHAVTVRCVAVYIDPRDSAIRNRVESSVILNTSRDATTVLPEVAITSASGRSFNPLTDYKRDAQGNLVTDSGGNYIQDSEFEFKGVIKNSPSEDSSVEVTDVAKYQADGWGTEEILPANDDGLVTCAPTLDLRYSDGSVDQNAEFFFRKTGNGEHLDVETGKAFVSGIKGNTVVWNQMVQNGDFSEGMTGWQSQNSSVLSVSNGEMHIYKSSTGKTIQGGIQQSQTIPSVGHKYAIKFDAKIGDNATQTNISYRFGSDAVITALQSDYSTIFVIREATNTNYLLLWSYQTKAGVIDFYIKNVLCIDLTLIYGEGNEPTTVEEFEADFEKWFGRPLSYEAYNEGQLIPVMTTAIKTVGFNQWDEEWETGGINASTGKNISSTVQIRSKNYIPVIPEQKYHLQSDVYIAVAYDRDKNYVKRIKYSDSPSLIAIPANVSYLRFCSHTSYGKEYHNDICINLANDDSRNGDYESYWSRVSELPITTVKGHLQGGTTVEEIFPDGMKRVGDVYDEIKVENGKVVAYKRIGSIDLGTLNWAKRKTNNNCYQVTGAFLYKKESNPKILLTKYSYEGSIAGGNDIFITPDKTLCAYYSPDVDDTIGNRLLYVHDESYTTAAAFKASVSGVILYYELATPLVYDVDEFQPYGDFVWFGVDNGVEKRIETLPWYVSGQSTNTLKVDAMWSEDITVVLRCTMENGRTDLSPSRDYASVRWRIPDVDTHVVSANGNSIRSNMAQMDFSVLCNVKGQSLPQAVIGEHLRLQWVSRRSNSSTETQEGYGLTKTIAAGHLRSSRGATSQFGSTLVYPYVYLLGAWKVRTSTETLAYDAPTTTKGGVTYIRTID